jgi:ferredoxin
MPSKNDDFLIWGIKMAEDGVYAELASYLSMIYLKWLSNIDDLIKILKLSFTPEEAEALLSIPAVTVPVKQLSPLSEIAKNSRLEKDKLERILDSMASRGLVYSGTVNNEKGYALPRAGYGFTQVFFWDGARDDFRKEFTKIHWKYHFPKRGDVKPQNFRYLPLEISIENIQPDQAVYPFDQIVEIVKKAEKIAVAHCVCRVRYELATGEHCGHPEEVCLKFNELAEHIIRGGLGREVSKEEALEIVKLTEEAGLVHFTDNSRDGIVHNCNCCGCACWNLGAIKRRLVPRDEIIATYFIRETDYDLCSACGSCADVCPVDAVTIDEFAEVDEEWCVGCGVCVKVCPTSAITMKRKTDDIPPATFEELHRERERAFLERLEKERSERERLEREAAE